MSSEILSPKLVGAGRLGSYDRRKINASVRRSAVPASKAALLLLCLFLSSAGSAGDSSSVAKSSFTPSKAAAQQCDAKLKRIEDFADTKKSGQTQTTQLSEEEVNSYFALDLSATFHPSLKSLALSFEENRLRAVASIDFDRLSVKSTKLLPKLMSWLFSGIHTLSANGHLASQEGKANFALDQARFDDTTLPKYLVEEIISAVGRKQNPPFDPLQPSKLPCNIESIAVHSGYIAIRQ